MASTIQKRKFRVTLLKISKLLTVENVKDLSSLCENFNQDTRERITTGKELFDELQHQDQLSEQRPDYLIELLEETNLLEASQLLNDYQRLQNEDDKMLSFKCLSHNYQELNYYCTSCDSKACSDCVISRHNNTEKCKVLGVHNFKSEISNLQEEMMQSMQKAERHRVSVETMLETVRDVITRSQTNASAKIGMFSSVLLDNIRMRKEETLKYLGEKSTRDNNELHTFKKGIQTLQSEFQELRKVSRTSKFEPLEEVRHMAAELQQIREIRHQLVNKQYLLQEKTVNATYKKIPISGAFCTLETVTLVGSSLLDKFKVLNIYDERHINGEVVLKCVDCKNTTNSYWNHRENIANDKDPVVMSHTSVYSNDAYDNTLFAVGRKVFTIKIQFKNSQCNELDSVSPILIKEVPVGSWITSIAAHSPDNNPSDDFVISISNEHLIREYNISGFPLRLIDTKQIMPSSNILKVAYYKNKFAVVFKDVDEVVMINCGIQVKRFGALKLTPPVKNMFPINVIWTGNRWVALFVKKEATAISWKVVDYIETMGLMSDQLCDEGTTSGDFDIPVSVTRYGDTGYLTFGNDSVRTIQFVD